MEVTSTCHHWKVPATWNVIERSWENLKTIRIHEQPTTCTITLCTKPWASCRGGTALVEEEQHIGLYLVTEQGSPHGNSQHAIYDAESMKHYGCMGHGEHWQAFAPDDPCLVMMLLRLGANFHSSMWSSANKEEKVL